MTLLTPETYLEHIRVESARFRDVLATCDPAARVPTCPDWSAEDLLWHLTSVQWFWSTALIDRPAEVDEAQEPERPAAYAEVLRAFDEWSAVLSSALEGVDPKAEAWTWSDDHTVGFILRRQAHEALVHRLDAEQTARVTSVEVDANLAADGVAEMIGVMFGGCPRWGSWEPLPHYARLDCTDTGDELWAQFGLFSGTDPDSGDVISAEEDFHLVEEPVDAEPDVVIDGPAAALDAWLWHRGDDTELSIAGDRSMLDRFRAIVSHPIN
ncbi:maleylpyruvate isomerase N-terminal domain-containing protein [Nocardioides sp.]|uniref:maleylpyruvate isomerase N-terminal domain-containing protein n=1 Tax=Nocardioides sp. TaxID=35761 RepID=UPI00286E691B|nr:maleylpyruvate isomerase N-terminal domain-containing protein [Nocardioides sp.]